MDNKKAKKISEQEFKRRRSNVKQLLEWYCEQHKYPTTRRELLSAGLITFGGSLFLPTFMGMNKAHAQADVCDSGGATTNDMPAFINLSLGGGAMFAGNLKPQDIAGSNLASYTTLGMGGTPGEVVVGGALWWDQSPMLSGLQETASAAVLANTRIVSIPCRSTDDTRNNQMDATGMVLAGGLSGAVLPNMGVEARVTGARHNPAIITPPNALRVTGVDDMENAISLAGALGTMSNAQAGKLLKLVQDLNSEQGLRAIQRDPAASNLAKLAKCAAKQNTDLIANGVDVNAQDDPQIQAIWNVQANTDNRNNNNPDDDIRTRALAANMVNAAITGQAASASLSSGGYDYHLGRNRGQANVLDVAAGRSIGRILETAALRGRPTFIYVNSDGATRTQDAQDSDDPGSGNSNWRGDSGSQAMGVIFAYHPGGAVENVGPAGMPQHQVGGFQGASVNTNYFTGNNPSIMAAAVFANYMSFAGKTGQIESVIPGTFSSAQIDEIIRLGKDPAS